MRRSIGFIDERNGIDDTHERPDGAVDDLDVPVVRTGGPRRRWFATAWRVADRFVDREIAAMKDDTLLDLPAEILELGAGRGSNFGRYPAGARVTVAEPNRYMHGALRAAATEQGLELELHGADLRTVGLPTGSFDAVVSTLTLCSVPDRTGLVAEVRRVLRPGGRFLFVEHVAEPDGTFAARVQRVARRPWRWAFDGCDPCADTELVLLAGGFAEVRAQTATSGPAIVPTRRHHWGVAVR